MAYHLSVLKAPSPTVARQIVAFGWAGVPVFFVLSGFLIVQSAQRNPRWREFAIRRWWRIYPPFAASVVVVLGVAFIRKITTGTNDAVAIPRSVIEWLASLTLTTQPFSHFKSLNWVDWSLGCEVAYYGVIALVLAAVPRRLGLGLILVTAACLIPTYQPALHVLSDTWPLFALGSTLALGLRTSLGKTLLGVCLGAITVQHSQDHQWFAPQIALATWLSVIWSRSAAGSWLNREQVFSRIGVISYSLYLIHVPIGLYLLFPIFSHAFPSSSTAELLSDLTIYMVCLAFAWAFWRWVEQPAHRRGQRLSRSAAPSP